MKKNVGSKSRIIRREIERKFSSEKKVNKKDLKSMLYKMKYNLKAELSQSIINSLDVESKTFLLGCPLPNSYNLLRTVGTTSFKFSFHSEINWLVLSLSYFHEDITLFLSYEKQFENAFLIGEYNKAKQILDKIDSEICVSLWSIEKRLLLTEYCKEQAQTKNELIELIKNNAERLVKINSSYLGIRFEAQLPPNRFDEILDKFIARQKNTGLSDYFLFRLNYYNNLSIAQPELALYLESNLSIIDRYQIFIQIILSLLCNKKPNNLHIEAIKSCVLTLTPLIPDDRLINISSYLDTEHEGLSLIISIPFLKILEKFNTNSFEECYTLCLSELENKPYSIEVAEIFVKTCIILDKICPSFGNQDCLFNTILSSLYNIFEKNSEYETSIYRLTKIAKSISCPLWCNKLIEILNNEQPIQNSDYNFRLHRLLSFPGILPDLSLYITDETKLKSFVGHFKNSNCFFPSTFSDPRVISEFSDNKIGKGLIYDLNTVNILEQSEEYTKALSQIDSIINHPKYEGLIDLPFIHIEVIKKRISIHIKTGDILKGLELLCGAIISNEKLLFSLNNEILQAAVLTSDNIEIQKNICTPILARAYKERINDIWIAYDNFMYQNNFTFPKEMFNTSLYDEHLLKFFLRYVCIQDVYDSSPSFTSPEDLDNERIKICNHLCIVDSENKELYINEITETETRALIKKGIKEVDESKIYVDTTGIWREIESEIKERFTRGREILKMSKNEVDYLLEMSTSVLVLFLSKNEDEGSLLKFDKTKTREAGIKGQPHFENFKETFLLVRDRFISSNEFGLDSYVSMRIRHGTLLGQIRSIFERYNLITKKDNYTKQYIRNEYWLQKISVDNPPKQSVSEKLNNFSESIDQMSEQIKNSFLQIKTEEKSSDGLFDYRYDDKELVSLYENKFYSIDNHTAFFETMVDVLWERTEKNLNNIREKFVHEYSKGALKNLEELFNSVEKQKKSNTTIETSEFFRDITACKTDTSNAFEKISLWFRRSYSNSINEFDIKLVINICFSIVNKMHPLTPILSPKITIESDVILKGQYFAFFIDIMRNILDNIVDRSELAEPNLKVIFNVKQEKGLLKINLENNVSATVDLDAANRKIATTQLRINNNEGQALAKQEGGSGYLKIKNILKSNLKRTNYTLNIEPITNDRIFKSYVAFELDNLTK